MLHFLPHTMSKWLLAICLALMPLALPAQEQNQQSAAADAPAAATGQTQPPAGILVYKSVNKDGQAVFTDKPPADRPSDAVTVKPSNTISLPSGTGNDTGEENSTADQVYTSLTVTSPRNEEYFGQEVESITVSATALPGIQEGHTAQLYCDGNPIGDSSLFYTIDQPERGTHTVVAKVFNARGKLMIESKPVQFYVRRISLLNQPKPEPTNNNGGGNGPSGGATPPPQSSGFGGAKGFGGSGGFGVVQRRVVQKVPAV